MTDRNRELVPDSWNLERERALTTGLNDTLKWLSPLHVLLPNHSGDGSVALGQCSVRHNQNKILKLRKRFVPFASSLENRFSDRVTINRLVYTASCQAHIQLA